MAESYDIFLTDPLSAAFKVRAFTSNGTVFPTSSSFSLTAVSADTSLLVFGKGHPEYGERIGENMLHIMESFSGSTEPQNPISGQSWFVRYVVIRSDGTNFHLWTDNPLDLVNGGSWTPLIDPTNITQGPLSARPAVNAVGVSDGDYFFATDTLELYLAVKDSSSPLSPTWLLRSFEDRSLGGAPALTDRPRKEMRFYNGSTWVSANQINPSEVEPANQIKGELWYDTTVPQLKIHNGTAFVSVSELYLLLDGTAAMTGNLDMGINRIFNLSNPTTPQDAATKNYVDTLTGALPTNLNDLSDVTVAAPTTGEVLKYVGPDWQNVALLLTDFGMNPALVPSELDFSIGLTSNIQAQITNLDTLKFGKTGGPVSGPILLPSNPTSGLEAATKQYVDSEIVLNIIGLPDNIIGSGSITQTTPTLEITLVPTINTDPDVIIDISHTHISTDVTHTSALSPLRDLNPGTYPNINLSNVIENSTNEIFNRLNNIDDFARREIFTAVALDTDFEFTDGKYIVGSNRLNVYVDGLKQYANIRARQAIKFIEGINISATSLLGLAVDDYDLNIAVDTAATTNIVFSLDGTSTINDIINDINVALGTGATATWNNVDTSIQVFSAITGNLSAIDITVGGLGVDPDLLASLAAVTPGVELPVYQLGNIFPAFPTNVTNVTADEAYKEMVVSLTSGSQEVNVGGTRLDASPTGLANDATVYTAAIVVDGGASQPISVTGSQGQDYITFLSEINLILVGASAFLSGGNILIQSFSTGVTSSIATTDTDLFSTLTDYIAINAAVAGTQTVIEAPYGIESTVIQFNAAMAGGEVIEMISE